MAREILELEPVGDPPYQEGGLGIIDHEIHSRALISKLIVRGLLQHNEPSKAFLCSAVTDSVSLGGGD